jgi:hypothetical protein
MVTRAAIFAGGTMASSCFKSATMLLECRRDRRRARGAVAWAGRVEATDGHRSPPDDARSRTVPRRRSFSRDAAMSARGVTNRLTRLQACYLSEVTACPMSITIFSGG